MRYSPCIGMKYSGLIILNINFNSSILAWPEVWISLNSELVNTRTPRKYSLLMMRFIPAALPGIGLEEKITKSSGNKLICLCVPLAMRDKAAKGSPCEPVHKIQISFFLKSLAAFDSIKIDLS